MASHLLPICAVYHFLHQRWHCLPASLCVRLCIAGDAAAVWREEKMLQWATEIEVETLYVSWRSLRIDRKCRRM